MIRINLAPSAKKGRVVKAKAKGVPVGIKLPPVKITIFYIIGLIIVLAIIAITWFSQLGRISGLNNDITQLNAKLDELKVYKATVDSLEKRERELGNLIRPIAELNENRFFIAHVLDEISSRTPEFTWLTSLDISQTNLYLRGITASNLLVADFMNRLEESPYIHNVDLTVLEKKPVGKQEMMDFTLTAGLGFNP
jgi:Tfp pilus assembly protein PilN